MLAEPIKLSLTPKNITAAILCGGRGTRLSSIVADVPKPLVPIGGQPFLTYLFRQLEAARIEHVVLCTGHKANQFVATYGNRIGALNVTYSRESEPLGTGGALRKALDYFESEYVLIMNGDSYLDAELMAFANESVDSAMRGHIACCWSKDVSRFGRVIVENDCIVEFCEKSQHATPGWINAGVYLLPRTLIASIPSCQNISLESQVFPCWIQQGLGAWCTHSQFIDIGTPESYAKSEMFFQRLNLPSV